MNRRFLIAIGLTVVVSLLFVVRALIFLHPSPGDGKTRLCVRFQDVDKITQGSRVTFAGRPVGEVVSVHLLQESFSGRSGSHRPIYPYEVILAIDSSVKVYTVDEIAIKTAGLMGEHFIAITPKPPDEGEELMLVQPTDVIFAYDVGSPEQTIQEITSVARKADLTMGALISVIERNQEGIYQTTEAIRKASSALETLLSTLNSGGFGQRLVEVGDKSGQCLDKIDRVSTVLETVINGEGSLGKMLRDSSLYDSVLQASLRTNTLISDIDSYGLLFHTNRDWQREMCRRSTEESTKDLVAQQFLKERFEKIHRTVSELQQTVALAEKRLQEMGPSSEPLAEHFSTMQQQIADLQASVRENHSLKPREDEDED